MTILSEPTVHQLFDLSQRVAMVTGGGGHLGSSLCRALAEAGASVIVTSRRRDRAEALVGTLPRVGTAIHRALELDHLCSESLAEQFLHAVDQTGGIDILVNNGHEAAAADWTTITAQQFSRQLENATGYFLLARLLRDHAVQRGGSGNVIFLGSMYALVGSYPDAYEGVSIASPVAYHALKGSIVQMTRHLAVYWAKDQVRVNCLSPGPFPGPNAPEALVERLKARSPMGRMGAPHELKGALLFLASEASSYCTGLNLVVDGGWTAW